MSAGAFTLSGLDVPESRAEVSPPFVLCAFDTESNAVDGLVTEHSVDWAVSVGLLPPHAMNGAAERELGHLVGYGYPRADYEQLRLMGDWALFAALLRDDGVSGDDLELLLAVLRDQPVPPGDPRVRAMVDLRGRLLALGGAEWVEGFAVEVGRMFDAITRSSLDEHHGTVPTPEAHAEVCELTIGLHPMFHFAGPVDGIDLPPPVREHSALRELAATACRIVGYARDLYAHRAEIARGGVHNLVLVTMRAQAVVLDQAVDRAVEIHDGEVRDFVRRAEELPSFGPPVDEQVRDYVALLRRWVGGHRKWAEYTGTYR
ncbi:terpene synthase family protein [Umezawaea sp. Da 62-37]|uniref:terpene synthase family protein n=1 Tax=Umezawaea sp. Da 62-37 TaxID=3075927 RepID=UPI0028F6EFF7|nr:terpene synthase family protein [Umezawaea sp. Da 62-37]WNV89132.1 terpene synthase family protein [Umezawaea sp. Da 62-37]